MGHLAAELVHEARRAHLQAREVTRVRAAGGREGEVRVRVRVRVRGGVRVGVRVRVRVRVRVTNPNPEPKPHLVGTRTRWTLKAERRSMEPSSSPLSARFPPATGACEICS